MKIKRKQNFFLIIILYGFLILNSLTLINFKTSAHYPNTFVCSARLVSHNITIDGRMTGNEWNSIENELLFFDFLDEVYVGRIYFAWDSNFLYLFAKILDGNESSDRALFIFFDEAHNGALDGFEDIRGLFSNNSKLNKHVNESGDQELDVNEANFHACHNFSIETGYQQFEMAIPFSTASENLNITPEFGLVIGINLEYWNGTHYDDYPDSGRRKVVWSDQARYGDLKLARPIIDYDFGPLITYLIVASIIVVILISIITGLKLRQMRKKKIIGKKKHKKNTKKTQKKHNPQK